MPNSVSSSLSVFKGSFFIKELFECGNKLNSEILTVQDPRCLSFWETCFWKKKWFWAVWKVLHLGFFSFQRYDQIISTASWRWCWCCWWFPGRDIWSWTSYAHIIVDLLLFSEIILLILYKSAPIRKSKLTILLRLLFPLDSQSLEF